MKKVINFVNKSFSSILLSFENLKKRYKKVEFVISRKNNLCNGYFLVEGVGRRQLKYQ